jgi:hypothetical protein
VTCTGEVGGVMGVYVTCTDKWEGSWVWEVGGVMGVVCDLYRGSGRSHGCACDRYGESQSGYECTHVTGMARLAGESGVHGVCVS